MSLYCKQKNSNKPISHCSKSSLKPRKKLKPLRDIGGDETKINTYLSEMNSHEETGLEILTALELNELELQEVKGFLSGLEKTILEITHEVETEIAQEEKSISHIDQRLQSLMDELPDDFKMILQKTLTRNLALGPFTRIEAGSCYFCRYKISRIDESEIDMQKKIKICPQCSRIFLPYGA
jgi:predicted  nucleic acid-binding Zn-ribbon protein